MKFTVWKEGSRMLIDIIHSIHSFFRSRTIKQMCPAIMLCVLAVIAGGCKDDTAAAAPKKASLAAVQTGDGREMVLIEAGHFEMGFQGSQDAPVHRVEISSFLMDRTEVTQKSFQVLMGFNPSKFTNDDSPVECVRWMEAIKYCNARSKADNLEPCYDEKTLKCNFEATGYRLPTEAEWEFACRAGTPTERYLEGSEAALKRHGWYRDNSNDTTHPVAQKQPNPWGLFDMYGNVAEWCFDYYDEAYYTLPNPQKNPAGPESGKERVIRGGSWQSRGKYLNSHYRQKDDPALADICQGYPIYGFRCVRSVK